MFGKINIFLALILHGVIISFCSLNGFAAVAQTAPGAYYQIPGFINIDCGATEEYPDDERQIWYQTDSGYIDSGENREVLPEVVTGNVQPLGKTLRSFPYGKRNCYTLKPEKGENQTYLIRATFLYGNYDRKNQTPTFELHIGVNKWATIMLQNISSFIHYEIEIVPPKGDLLVCLVNIGRGNPFINGLELRILDQVLYQPGRGGLRTWWRYNVGAQQSKSLRHPDDDYDRIWERPPFDDFPNWLPISNKSIFNTNGTNDLYKVPDQVLMTAAISSNASIPLSYQTKVADAETTTWHMYFHFAEIQQLEDGLKRKVRVSVNNKSTEIIALEYAKPMTLSLPFYGSQVNFSIYASEGSKLPPIVNAIELLILMDLPNVPTLSDDVDAMTSIKKTYVVSKDWQGDPCVPKNYAWEGVNCSYDNPPRIVSLNLSYSGLSGLLPEFFGNLSNLKVLDLRGNNLTGPIPSILKNRIKDGSLLLRLAGNPLCQIEHCDGNKRSTMKRFHVQAIASISSVVVFLIISCALLLFWRNIRKQNASRHLQKGRPLQSRNRQFRYKEVVQITKNLKDVIGEGGFGKVYLGNLTNGNKVAVKLLAETSMQGCKEFQAEAQLLNVNHKNIVSLIGYCHDGGNMALVYEYMANSSLRHHLSATTEVLSWNQRLHIALDAAQGLEYLHNGCKPPIVHRDLKPSNILLDENMKAKIADFGLSRSFLTESTTHVITRVAGTIGYLDPEFHTTGNLSKASDVYSFGIILFELITGRSAIIKCSEESISIVDWVRPLIDEGYIQKIMDPTLHGEFKISSAWKAIGIAKSSTLAPRTQRPNMSTILVELKECLAIQLGSDSLHGVEDNSTYSSQTVGGACLDPEAFSIVNAR